MRSETTRAHFFITSAVGIVPPIAALTEWEYVWRRKPRPPGVDEGGREPYRTLSGGGIEGIRILFGGSLLDMIYEV